MKELDIKILYIKNLIYKDGHAGKIESNPKTHKEGNEIRLIINLKNQPTAYMAKYVEEKLENHVRQQRHY